MSKKRSLSLMLVFTVVFTTVFAGAGFAFADETSEDAYIPFNYNSVDWDDEEDVNAIVDEKMCVFTDEIPVKISKYGHYIHEVTVASSTSGTVTASVLNAYGTVVATEEITLYDDGSGYYIGWSMLEHAVTKKGTYTVIIESEADGEMAASYIGYYLPQSTKSYPADIVNDGEMFYDNPSSGYSWFKVKVAGTRNLKIQLSEGGTYKVRLYKSDKSKYLGGGTVYVGSSKNYTTYYAVPKGTYYVRIYKSESATPYYTVKMSTSKVTEKSGSSKSKASSMSKNVTKKGTLLATQTSSSSADWYKVTLDKSQTFYMHLNFKTGGISKGGVKISVYKKGQSEPVMTKKFSSGESSWDWKIYTTGNNGKLAKGTYYFKVQKYNYGNGYYSMKWNGSKSS